MMPDLLERIFSESINRFSETLTIIEEYQEIIDKLGWNIYNCDYSPFCINCSDPVEVKESCISAVIELALQNDMLPGDLDDYYIYNNNVSIEAAALSPMIDEFEEEKRLISEFENLTNIFIEIEED